MKNVSAIIDSFGGASAFASFFKVSKNTVNTWRRRNYLPPDRDIELIKEAGRRKISLSYHDLAKIRKTEAAF